MVFSKKQELYIWFWKSTAPPDALNADTNLICLAKYLCGQKPKKKFKSLFKKSKQASKQAVSLAAICYFWK